MSSTHTPTTQNFVPIRDIREGVVILKDGQMCSVLLASSINFGLKSFEEQQAILSQFQAFLNTIDFSLQIYIQSRKLDVRPYLELLTSRESAQDNDLMRIQLREYIDFIRKLGGESNIMTKNFFIVVSYTPLSLEVKGLNKLFGRKESAANRDDKFYEDRSQLEQRIAIVEQGLSRIGVRTVLLNTEELTELYYHIFNPEDLSNAPRQ